MKWKLGWGLIGLVGLHAANMARADEVYTFVIKKQEQKKATRWSLGEWLATKERIQLMDMWLAMHTPTPYEFYLGMDYQLTTSATGSSENQARVSLAAFATIFGIEVEHRFGPEHDSQILGLLRFFGYHSQGSNLTLEGGVRFLNQPFSGRSGTFGIAATWYLTQFFGVDGYYRYYFASVGEPSGVKVSGGQWDAGGFIDYSALRIFCKYFNEAQTAPGFSGERSGISVGTRFYF